MLESLNRDQWSTVPWYSWNIAKVGVKHQSINGQHFNKYQQTNNYEIYILNAV